MPGVSVLLPVRDARDTLARCLRSLSEQTLEDHEVLAVDDGSRDGTAALLEREARRDPRLRVLSLPASGLVAALNAGLEDYDLWLRAFAAGLRFGKLEQTLLGWRDAPGRLTRTDPRYARERFQALKLEALLRGPLGDRPSVVIWGAGRSGKAWAKALLLRGRAVAAFVEVDGKKIGQRIQGARVVAVAEAGRFRGPLHLAAVGQPGARERIRGEAWRLGLVEGRDLVAVA